MTPTKFFLQDLLDWQQLVNQHTQVDLELRALQARKETLITLIADKFSDAELKRIWNYVGHVPTILDVGNDMGVMIYPNDDLPEQLLLRPVELKRIVMEVK